MAIAYLLETAASSLLEPPKFRLSSLKCHHHSRVSSPPLFPFSKHHHQIRITPHSSLHPNLCALAPRHALSQSTEEDPSSLLDKFLNAILKTLNLLRKPAIVSVLLGVLILGHPFNHAIAASGGAIGGDSWSSSSSNSSSSYSSRSSSGSSSSNSSRSSSDSSSSIAACYSTKGRVITQPKKTTVIKLQVCLLGSARSFQRDLDQLAEKADTSTKAGLSHVLTEASSSLLRHTDSCISAYSSLDSVKDAQKLFNQLSIEERAKFDEETLVNLNNIKRQTSVSHSSSSFSNEYIVAVQVLWTPQKEGDTLPESRVLADYPLLRPL
ncbi:hypothetical protein LUZ61_001475 [Rhynchospora tenuis]|uniref:Uncharacterized protein n=1 Tax=Rhynchospora tenuis TaxID=198213 RepID=A0AAD5ZH66_9POAL|nr:hypothetical protein LUZ61_001475 [Rhynchospora tenuis]